MDQKKFGLREQKFGDKRIELLNAFIDELGKKQIQAISVDSICDTAKISKVTFFNYFESKEQVLYYFIHKWQYNLNYDIETKKLFGASGIYHVFEAVTGEKYSLNLMLAIVQYFIKLEVPPQPMQISDYEFYLFNREAYEMGTSKRGLYEILMYLLDSMNCRDKAATIECLFSVFYGIPIAVKIMCTRENLLESYRNSLNLILNNCQEK